MTVSDSKDTSKDTSRDVFLTIGKKTYPIKTPLRDDVLERVGSLISQACDMPMRGVDQETLLMLTCLQLAYTLDVVTTGMSGLLERLEDLERASRPNNSGSSSVTE